MAEETLTISKYLSSKVRNIEVPDDAVTSIILDAGITTVEVEVSDSSTSSSSSSSSSSSTTATVTQKVTKDTDVALLSTKERELCLAWLYAWVAGSPTQWGGYSEEDADWRKTENGERMSANVLKNYLAMANAIFEKYGLDTISTGRWKFVGHGIRHPQKRP